MKQGRRIVVAACTATVAATIALLLRFPPMRYSFYPRCPIKALLHLDCPGCGATRALAALLHGHLSEALHLNALFVVLLPFLAGYAALCANRAWTQETFRWPSLPQPITYAGLVLALLFTIVRNLH